MLLAVSQLILALDYTIIFVALPSLGAELGFSALHLQWVVSAYSLVYGGSSLSGKIIRSARQTPNVYDCHGIIRPGFSAWRLG